ncbi:uncharacterized protein TRAVEDRAFT_48177 [Trametes versicolor FP-101664 SS1]|uniref:uncharacterized protein n=1 Tax=Trametes versicolor (strain FP-101664) TaxID=717944 RepID=UPI000462336E|nr:uncharacterized protein TRAVEDRAFT_48177 [Trametes versicolor FP-101664 SS1]EIW57124.1 hypothetical protein TRAVEDRAFT_48177 [Trametes versicolor FP-101664 SS1]
MQVEYSDVDPWEAAPTAVAAEVAPMEVEPEPTVDGDAATPNILIPPEGQEHEPTPIPTDDDTPASDAQTFPATPEEPPTPEINVPRAGRQLWAKWLPPRHVSVASSALLGKHQYREYNIAIRMDYRLVLNNTPNARANFADGDAGVATGVNWSKVSGAGSFALDSAPRGDGRFLQRFGMSVRDIPEDNACSIWLCTSRAADSSMVLAREWHGLSKTGPPNTTSAPNLSLVAGYPGACQNCLIDGGNSLGANVLTRRVVLIGLL